MLQPTASKRRTAGDTIRLAPRDAQPASWPPQRQLLRHVRAVRRIVWMFLFTPAACLIQAVLLATSPSGRVAFAVFYWKTIAQMLGLQVRVIGAPLAREPGRRPVIYVCNHSSWLDIPALGGLLRACFVSKDDVAGWPIVGTIARLGRTVFVSRSRQGISRERDLMQERLRAGDDLILFPEGTSSDGSRVLPFHSSFFAAAYGEAQPLIQPVSVVYDRLANLPVGRSSRAVFSWYGDMELTPHVWRIAQWRGKRVTLLFHTPLDPAAYASRKALSQATWQIVADGAATLRQNRPATPLPVGSLATPARPALA
jgi:1-acyl-sn-glycerol-3-phosphate acyltransferase